MQIMEASVLAKWDISDPGNWTFRTKNIFFPDVKKEMLGSGHF